jgi:hypothetical protein
MFPARSEMQNAGPSTSVMEVPEIVALALVVHGWLTYARYPAPRR